MMIINSKVIPMEKIQSLIKMKFMRNLKIFKEKNGPNLIHIPVVFYLKTFRIITNGKNRIKEYPNEYDDLISKSFLEFNPFPIL